MTLGDNSAARGRANDRMREELQRLLKEQAELAGLNLSDVGDLETAAWSLTVRRARGLLEVLRSAAAVRERAIEQTIGLQPGTGQVIEEVAVPDPPSLSVFDPKKASRAVVACGHGQGVLLDWIGDGIFWAIESAGCERVEDLGLVGPDGVSIWEGHYVDDGPGDWPGAREYALEGTFRPLTPEEWRNLGWDEHPWDPEEWRAPNVSPAVFWAGLRGRPGDYRPGPVGPTSGRIEGDQETGGAEPVSSGAGGSGPGGG